MSRHSGNKLSGASGHELKVVVLGDSRVGKTSLVLRYISGVFNPDQVSTIGAFFLTKKVVLDNGLTIKMNLWDTAGQEKFRSMAPMYYRNADAAVVCFDVTKEESFVKMKDWVDELRNSSKPENAPVLAIVANKVDCPPAQREVSRARSEEYAALLGGAIFVETSAKEDIGIKELFQLVSQRMWDQKVASLVLAKPGGGGGKKDGTGTGAFKVTHAPPVVLGPTGGADKKSKCC